MVEEKYACQSLLDTDDETGASKAQKNTLAERMRDIIKNNCDFICGSVAEVERLWSVAKKVLTNNRSCLTTVMFETLIFLKINEDYWDLQSVQTSHSMARKPKRTKEIEVMITEEEGKVDLINV